MTTLPIEFFIILILYPILGSFGLTLLIDAAREPLKSKSPKPNISMRAASILRLLGAIILLSGMFTYTLFLLSLYTFWNPQFIFFPFAPYAFYATIAGFVVYLIGFFLRISIISFD